MRESLRWVEVKHEGDRSRRKSAANERRLFLVFTCESTGEALMDGWMEMLDSVFIHIQQQNIWFDYGSYFFSDNNHTFLCEVFAVN